MASKTTQSTKNIEKASYLMKELVEVLGEVNQELKLKEGMNPLWLNALTENVTKTNKLVEKTRKTLNNYLNF